ncbi:MAG TPA: LysM peptidoglycan-binding domain-containing protein [Myxococcales bacterium]
MPLLLVGSLAAALFVAAAGSEAVAPVAETVAVDAGVLVPAPASAPAAAPADAGAAAADAADAADAAGAADAEEGPTAEATEAAVAEEPAAPSADLPEDPASTKKQDEASREMEELRAAEAAVVDEGAKRALELFRTLRRAGPASPLRQRLGDVLGPGRALPVVPDEGEMEAAALAEIGSFDVEKAKALYDIPIDKHPLVAEFIHFFQVPGRKHFVRWLSRSGRYLPMMKKALREAGLPEDTVYLSMIESGFAPAVQSKAKAVGLWQFIEPTGKRFGLRVDFWEDERRDPVKSTYAAAAYLKELYTEFGDWRLAWAGYNSGAGTVRLAVKKASSADFWTQIETKRAYKQETRHYVPKLMAAALISKHTKSFGFQDSEIPPEPPLDYEDAEVPEATDLEVVARAAGTTVDLLKDLNPSLRRWCTPPSKSSSDVYKIHLPPGTAERFAEEFPKIAPKDRMHFVVHLVGKGDTLSKIALRYGSASEAIMRANGLRDSRYLKLRSELVVPVPRGGGGAAREALVQSARRQGFKAAPSDEEVPAAPPPPRKTKSGALAGSTRTVTENGKTRTVYAVADGDSLWSIARRFDVKVAQLKDWNGMVGAAKLHIGEELNVYPGAKAEPKPQEARAQAAAAPAGPQPAKEPAPAAAQDKPKAAATPVPASGKHLVEQGDSLWSIARRYQIHVEELKQWNGLEKKKLKVGQELLVRPP